MANVKTGQVAKINNNAGVAGAAQGAAQQTVGTLLQAMLDRENYRNRFQELLGKRMPSFMGSLVSMVNADENLKAAFLESPMSVIQSALKAASYNLPIDKSLGFAYVIPFNTKKKVGNKEYWAKEAQFILGYKGMVQLANRTGAYSGLNVVDVREGELKKWDRLTEEYEIEWIEDEDVREATPIVGFIGYFKLVNGFSKVIYRTVKQIDQHEQKFRKGKYRSNLWATNYNEMAAKTVIRELISKWGLMSIDYQTATAQTIQFAQDIATGSLDDEEKPVIDIEAAEEVRPEEPEEALAEKEETLPFTED